jgi:catechol 2,3-dioxygenase-like lactoylglutathione lyase family enzyme
MLAGSTGQHIANRAGLGRPGARPEARASSVTDMTDHYGRIVDHVHLRVRDLAASKRFYRAALQAIGRLDAVQEGDHYLQADELYVDQADGPVSHVHLAFQARSEAEVQRFHALTLAAGGRDNGAPGPRPYHPGYYGAFVLDPDGNNIEAVFHGPADRSADSVESTRRRTAP